MTKRGVARWLLSGFGCAVALLLGECGLRLVGGGPGGSEAPPSRSAEMLRFSDDLHQGWELRPGAFDHNAAGFRGEFVSKHKPSNVRRVVTVGDSVTYGIGVQWDETFSAQLQRLLNAGGHVRHEVLNLGVPGYGTHQVRQLVAKKALAYDPDLVVMTFTPDDVEMTPVVIEVDGEMCLFQNPLEGGRFFDSRLHWTAFRHSHLYRLFYKGMVVMLGIQGEAGSGAVVSPKTAWRNVEETAELVRNRGGGFLLVLSPVLMPMCDPDGNPVDTPDVVARAQEAVRELAGESDIRTIDLEPVFAPHAGRLKISPTDHEHFNAFGHHLVAETLYSEVAAAGSW